MAVEKRHPINYPIIERGLGCSASKLMGLKPSDMADTWNGALPYPVTIPSAKAPSIKAALESGDLEGLIIVVCDCDPPGRRCRHDPRAPKLRDGHRSMHDAHAAARRGAALTTGQAGCAH